MIAVPVGGATYEDGRDYERTRHANHANHIRENPIVRPFGDRFSFRL
jgi:hypothetical protein